MPSLTHLRVHATTHDHRQRRGGLLAATRVEEGEDAECEHVALVRLVVLQHDSLRHVPDLHAAATVARHDSRGHGESGHLLRRGEEANAPDDRGVVLRLIHQHRVGAARVQVVDVQTVFAAAARDHRTVLGPAATHNATIAPTT